MRSTRQSTLVSGNTGAEDNLHDVDARCSHCCWAILSQRRYVRHSGYESFTIHLTLGDTKTPVYRTW